jgi:simple sugar transport system ATP-binding protein
MVQQHFSLVPSMSVLENVLLGLPRLEWWPRYHVHRRDLKILIDQFDLPLDPTTRVDSLATGQRQMVEILRLLYHDADTLILDEPTSQLNFCEIETLLKIFDDLKKVGKILIFISHKLPEVIKIADCITVLRQGSLVLNQRSPDFSTDQITAAIIGEKKDFFKKRLSNVNEEKIIELKNVDVRKDDGKVAVEGVSFYVKSGEVFGVLGVAGNGQEELAEAIVGLRQITNGSIVIEGKDVSASSNVYERKHNHRVSFVPSDRQNRSILMNANIMLNAVLRKYSRREFSRSGVIRSESVSKFTKELVEKFKVKLQTIQQSIRYLSGGNQQRFVIGRELSDQPGLLVIENACQGLDINATRQIKDALIHFCSTGKSILYISSDIEDVVEICNRVAVIYRGRIQDTLDNTDAKPETLGPLMVGLAAMNNKVKI